MKQFTTHEEQLVLLNRIEGQIRGLQKMIQDKRYCVDIITQIRSVIGALGHVENEIFKRHLERCVLTALKGKSDSEKHQKVEEIVKLISRTKKAVA